jgi:hypothetical protein
MDKMKQMISIICLPVLLTGCALLPLEYPYQRHILNISNTNSQAQFVCPKHSHLFRFVLGIPYENGKPNYVRQAPQLSGIVQVYNGTNIMQTLPIRKETLGTCNWLPQEEHLDGFAVDWPTTITNMLPGKTYDIRVNIPELPKTPLSLWMEFLSDGLQPH